jgi:hypothetical protein
MTAINKMTKEELIAHVAKQNETIRALRSQNAQLRDFEQKPWYEAMIEALTVESELMGRDGPYVAKITTEMDVAIMASSVANALHKKISQGGRYGLVAQQEWAKNNLIEALRQRDGTEFSQQRLDRAEAQLAAKNLALATWQDAFDRLREFNEQVTGRPMILWNTERNANVSNASGDAPTMTEEQRKRYAALGVDVDTIEVGTELNTNGIETDAA